LIFEKDDNIVFIEVKIVDQIEDLYGYIASNKLKRLKRTIKHFLFLNPKYQNFNKRVDVVFVKN
jgi:Holliday junction resolvase-like predicted endonuclease